MRKTIATNFAFTLPYVAEPRADEGPNAFEERCAHIKKELDESHPITKREYFAAQIMAGLCADANMNEDLRGAANCAVLASDSLIFELNKEKPDATK